MRAALSLLPLDSLKLSCMDCPVGVDVSWLGFELVSQIVRLRIPDRLIRVILALRGSVSVSMLLSSSISVSDLVGCTSDISGSWLSNLHLGGGAGLLSRG